jgi:hypothetical protein
MLVSEESFGNRREAVEAIGASRDVERLLGADVFLVDLEGATPVAVIGVSEGDAEDRAVATDVSADPGADASDEADPDEDDTEDDTVGGAVRLGVGEIDIESWTCEDCIYVFTCENSGTLRPVACGSFQWRA